MTEYDAIVYDLDGTLVRLDVDWADVAERCAAILRARGHDVSDANIWDMRELAAADGLLDRVDGAIAEFEREGARSAGRLALAEDLPHSVPVGVCSLNCEASCRIALELHGLDGHVDAVVGRDSHETVKPDPGPLLHAVELLGADPARSLFVGDSESDREAARAAGLDFQWVEDRV
ncbi:HAD family hydrolase [Halosimplex salinum]|uniref:HAD family hydrolase n=1 Tax=Halosimplex salinum TaxID=1710538 RepID=UPI000F492265|nr:HAD-IA family hydrolase [Halosimplex salinum]